MFPSPFRTLRPALLGLLLPVAAAAQTPAPTDTARAYKHQLGLTASPVLDGFFRNNRSLPLGLLYRRQLTPTKALRLRLVGQYSRRDTTNYLEYAPSNTLIGFVEGPNTTALDLNVYAGYEWKKPISKHFYYTYGLEAGFGWNRLRSEYLLQFSDPGQVLPAVETYSKTVNTWGVQTRPFVTLQYQVANRVLLFAESAVSIVYSHQQQDIVTKHIYYNGPGYGGRSNTANVFSVAWRPIQLIGAAVKF
ncbi:hypothetical protein MON38_14105 [Hymenobacter sp. DH14]|uniref:Outer membrane protein beta-barrel domain-containing protein n=1 Tax=Hymenobacter cyanobacteriorum TaxID=2926463 RepID=A0A9X2AJA2_9BACT|nr:hypothetical protein [Hymenobacter cyanobacteriorum]MCI1188559.1 hypothetical protein [Hymenobacter cyanobacteriorum]